MDSDKIFSKPLFVFDMANNHMGNLDHGIRILEEFGKAVKGYDEFNFAFKLQYRQLESFIHPVFKDRMDIKYVKRFSETRLSTEQYAALREAISGNGFIPICTPFDEKSVDLIEEQDFDVIKIASCSFTDWPLLERIVKSEKPIIASTASASLVEMDRVVSFFEHREKRFCLMHCIGAYPTPRGGLHLNQIDLLKNRYPDVIVGFSTHEEPDNVDAVKIAVAKGARILERHVAFVTDEYGINAYSSTPEQAINWIESAKEAFEMCGVIGERYAITDKETNDLRGLKRGVYATKKIANGEKITLTNTTMAIPNESNQIIANEMAKYTEYTAQRNINVDEPILYEDVEINNLRAQVLRIIRKLKEVIMESHIALPNKIELELSHHYGLEKYEEWGAAILNCINREYCKKIIVLLPGQQHPIHHHVKKEETFQVLFGEMKINLDGEQKVLERGELLTVERNSKHSFATDTGCVFEEVSTTHYKQDSFYEDPTVADNTDRKTQMTFWSEWLLKEIE